jgi:peptidyl-prolyl cis-trans isomerase SurA
MGPFPAGAEWVDRIVAVVNEDIILHSEMEKHAEDYRKAMKESGQGDIPLYLSAEQRSQLLEKMIDDKLLEQEAARLGISISESEIDQAILRIQHINKVSHEEMLQVFKIKGMDINEYREQIKEQLMQSRIVNREVKSRVVITEEQLKKYYDAHFPQYAGQTKYHLRHIMMKVSSPAPQERERVYRTMQQLRERLKNGEAFSALAEDYSQAPTAREGGDLGLFESRLLADNILDALASLKPGAYTDVVETEQGYQLFYVEDIVNAGGRSFEDVKDEIHEKLFMEVTEQKFTEWFKNLRRRAHISILE